jgi:serine/threonine-protein kinase RsbW
MEGEAPSKCEFETGHLLVREEFSLPADVRHIEPIVTRVIAIVREMGCADGEEASIELALFEALANAIRHGCKEDPTKTVQCCIACDEERGMLIIVRDPGPGFDPEAVPSPLFGQNLFAHHGRGIYLINQLMDEVSFQRGGTEIHMRKRPKSPDAGGAPTA